MWLLGGWCCCCRRWRLLLLLGCLHSLFVSDTVYSQETTSTTQASPLLLKDPNALDSIGEDVGSGDVDPDLYNLTGLERADSSPHLVVVDDKGHPCLLATLNATLQVSYRVPEGIVHETYIAMANIQLPEDVQAHGVCGENTSRLFLEWGNNTFHVNITFTRKEGSLPQENDTWALTELAVTYDLSHSNIFPGASETDVVTVERHHLSLFSASVGVTHECERDVVVEAGSNDRGVEFRFHNVKVAAFGVTSKEFPKSVQRCSEQEQATDEEDLLVPLIVACCLSAIVTIVVIAYVISRKLQEARDQSEYRQMP